MRNIYIETDENFRVTKIHRMPFDPNNGMGYTREELEKKGFFVESIPTPTNQVGRRAIAMYNPDTKSVYHEYVGVSLSDKERADQLENALNWMMRNAVFNSSYSVRAMAMTDDELKAAKIDSYEEGAAKYIASQIISGKLDMDNTLAKFPQFEKVIKDTLKDNGIQV